MDRCLVLLRGVNVGGHNRIAMADLRAGLVAVGCSEVTTYVQSGNAVVHWAGAPDELAGAVGQRLRDHHGLDVDVLVRTAAEVDAVLAANPFEVDDPTRLHVVFLSGNAPALDVDALLPDRVATGPGVLYVAYAGPSHRSKAAALLSGKRFPAVASARNWRTVLALRDLLRAP